MTVTVTVTVTLTLTLTLTKAGELSLSEHLKQGQLKSTERKHGLEPLASGEGS